MPSRKTAKRKSSGIPLPPATDWRTTDEVEILRRIQRARDEKHSIRPLDDAHPVFSTFEVKSPSGMTYQIEIRDLAARAFSCTCPDFRRAGLGTCKHVEATLLWLKRRCKAEFRAAEKSVSPRIDLVPAGDRLMIERNLDKLSPTVRKLYDIAGFLHDEHDPGEILPRLLRSKNIRVSVLFCPRTKQRLIGRFSRATIASSIALQAMRSTSSPFTMPRGFLTRMFLID